MIFVQNMVFITGIIGGLLVCCHSGLGNYLYLHRVFSYNRKKNIHEVYRFVGLETICVSGFLSLIYKGVELGGLLEPMGISGLLVIVWMILLSGMICHGYIPIFRGIGMIILSLFFIAAILAFIFLKGIQSNLYLTQIAIVLFVLNLLMWGIHVKVWKEADFL